MFWRMAGPAQASPIEAILDKDNFTLEELLDEDDFIQEVSFDCWRVMGAGLVHLH